MPFTVQELENIANATIDFHFKKGNVKAQTLQQLPLYDKLRGQQQTFPGGKDYITRRVKGVWTTTIQGFEADDGVSYSNPTNIRTANYPWKLHHAGISFTMHELLKNGISISDTQDGTGETTHSRAEAIQLANLLKDKLDDLSNGWDRGMNAIMWLDGTQDSKVMPGIQSFILDVPTSAVAVGGIDQVANPWWQNRASLAMSTASAANQTVVQTLQKEIRQLRRYGGKPNLWLAGSSFMDWVEQELRAKGNYTLEGWAGKTIDASVADLRFKGIDIVYDPTLDDQGRAKYAYVLDTSTIYPMVVDGEDMKKHAPARPENKYVFYRAVTWVGGLVCDQRNANGVYSIQ